ncbi:MAG: hypothetical protein GY859_38470 [Desulfobacterales bacterium]|nr:hypothetical protein [Desulfobacterales bacterium]
MTTFPRSPRLIKGAIVTVESDDPTLNVIVFQYNPHTLTRTLRVQTAGGEGVGVAGDVRYKGAPEESISLEVEIDAADQLEMGDGDARAMGIHPQLSALETLLYPKSAHVIELSRMLQQGAIEVVPPLAPFTIFIWGPKRVLPIRLNEFSVTEQGHDQNLNPIRASVSLGMQVLSYNDFPESHRGYHLFLAHQISKEAMGRRALMHNLDAVGG